MSKWAIPVGHAVFLKQGRRAVEVAGGVSQSGGVWGLGLATGVTFDSDEMHSSGLCRAADTDHMCWSRGKRGVISRNR